MTPEQLTASSAGGDVMADLGGDPLLGTDVTLQGAIFTLWAFFFHDALPVRSAWMSCKDRERYKLNPTTR